MLLLLRKFHRSALFLSVILAGSPAAVFAEENGAKNLLDKFSQMQAAESQKIADVQLYLDSHDSDSLKQGDVYGMLHHDYMSLREVLSNAKNWCDIVPQHLNIKACVYKQFNDSTKLIFFAGRKFYEAPGDTYQLNYVFSQESSREDYFRVSLRADHGPLGTSDYRIILEAVPYTQTETLMHFSYAYSQGIMADLATAGYFATLGSDKTGFSIVKRDSQGKPEYIKGIRGALERNAVRYYLALQSYIETLTVNREDRFKQRITRWFELTEQYHQQLYEMSRENYLQYKQRERENQLSLQQEMDTTGKMQSLETW